jgi:hypothetical protein
MLLMKKYLNVKLHPSMKMLRVKKMKKKQQQQLHQQNQNHKR